VLASSIVTVVGRAYAGEIRGPNSEFVRNGLEHLLAVIVTRPTGDVGSLGKISRGRGVTSLLEAFDYRLS
jgi:hypothetical protein